MSKPSVIQIIAGLLLCASVGGTAHLGQGYSQAVLGRPDAQWQFAFVLAPIPILLGALGLAISVFSRPPLSRTFTFGACVVTLAPLGLVALVWIHAY
jgi:hypothetical protein